jgi:translation elongation factor P/translation initiation factor 5A
MAHSEPSKSSVVSVGVNPVGAGQLKRGQHVLVDGFPCRIVQIDFAKPGKHGSRKAMLTGIDIMTKRKHEWRGPADANLWTFEPDRREYTFIDATAFEQKGDAFVEYLDEYNQAQRISVNTDLAKTIPQNSTAIKVLRAPTLKFAGKTLTDPITIESLESFA